MQKISSPHNYWSWNSLKIILDDNDDDDIVLEWLLERVCFVTELNARPTTALQILIVACMFVLSENKLGSLFDPSCECRGHGVVQSEK
jgi:hypothetical protein